MARAAHRRRVALDRSRGADRRAQPRQRHQLPARRQLHRPGLGATRRWLTASRRTRRRCSRSSRARVTSTRSKTSCSASRASSRATTSCGMALANPGLPVERRVGDRRRPAREPRAADHDGDRRRSSSVPVGVTTCRRSSTASSSWPRRRREHDVAEVRSAVALDDAQQAAARRGAQPRDRQARRGQGDRRPDPSSAGSSPRSATP